MKETLIDSTTSTGSIRTESSSDEVLFKDSLKTSNIDEDIYAVFINNPLMNDKNEKNKIDTSMV